MNKYNGWTNYETWLVNLWFDTYFESNVSPEYIRDEMTNYIDEFIVEIDNGFIKDCLNGFLSSVNYHELAHHYTE